MQTRQNGQRSVGVYSLLHNGPPTSASRRSTTCSTVSLSRRSTSGSSVSLSRLPSTGSRRIPLAKLNELANTINYRMLSLLKPKRTQLLIVRLTTQINIELFNFFKAKYNFTNRFIPNINFLDDLKLVKELSLVDGNQVRVDREQFFVKMNKKHDTIYNGLRIKGPCFLSLKFGKSEIVRL